MTNLPIVLVLAALSRAALGVPASDTLAGMDAAADVGQLRETLYNRSAPRNQGQAALVLLQQSAPEAAAVVKEALQRWDRPDVVQAVCAAIQTLGDGQFEQQLLKTLTCDQPAIRQAGGDALAATGDGKLATQLQSLAQDRSAAAATRLAAVNVLGKMPHKPAAGALIELLALESESLRQEAIAALEELTGRSFGSNLGQWQAWWSRQKNLSEQQWLDARMAYLAARSRRLRDDLQHAESHILQLHQQLFAKVPATDRPGHLRTLTRNEYAAVRGQAVIWIVELLPEATPAGQKTLIETLLSLSDDGAESVQRAATLALEKVNDPRAFERLVMLLGADSSAVRAAAARGLGRCRLGETQHAADLNNQAVAALEKALSDPSLAVVAEAAESLGSLGVAASAPILARLLRHRAEPVRQAAARGLERVAAPVVLADLKTGLDDPAASVRFSLVAALGRTGAAATLSDQQRIEILRRLEAVLIQDTDPGVRSRAATVLGDLGTPAELPLLWRRVTATEDNRVQLKAWNAMLDILSRSFNPTLVNEWDRTLAEQKQLARRLEMLVEIRARWLKQESAKPYLDELTALLVQAALAQKKWNQALPLALDLAKRASSDAELKKRLRWLLVAGNQALDEQNSQEVIQVVGQMLADVQGLLVNSGDLAAEFERLRQRTQINP